MFFSLKSVTSPQNWSGVSLQAPDPSLSKSVCWGKGRGLANRLIEVFACGNYRFASSATAVGNFLKRTPRLFSRDLNFP